LEREATGGATGLEDEDGYMDAMDDLENTVLICCTSMRLTPK